MVDTTTTTATTTTTIITRTIVITTAGAPGNRTRAVASTIRNDTQRWARRTLRRTVGRQAQACRVPATSSARPPPRLSSPEVADDPIITQARRIRQWGHQGPARI